MLNITNELGSETEGKEKDWQLEEETCSEVGEGWARRISNPVSNTVRETPQGVSMGIYFRGRGRKWRGERDGGTRCWRWRIG